MVQMAPGVEEEAASGNRKCALLSVGAKDCPVYVIDVHILGDVVWDTPAASGEVTLRSIFASESVVKLLWDCRFDNYTLVVGHGVRLTHVIDLQVLAAKQLSDRAGLPGLHRSTLNALWPGNTVADDFEAASEAGSKIWCPRLGGKLSTFRERPLLPELLAYSGQDVHILHSLLKVLEPYNTDECVAEMVQRLGQSGDPSWNPSAGVVLARNPFHTSRKKDTRKSKGRPKK